MLFVIKESKRCELNNVQQCTTMSTAILILQDIMENRFPLKLGAAYLGQENLSGILTRLMRETLRAQ